MELRKRLAAMGLALLLAAQLPFTAFANTAQQAQSQGQIVVVDENGKEQVVTAEQLNSGEALPENIVVSSEESDEAQAALASSAAVSTVNGESAESAAQAASESTAAASESTAAASESTAAASESTAAASESTAAASESTQAESENSRIDVNLPLVTTTQEQANRIDMNLPLVRPTDQAGQRVDETVLLNEAQKSAQETQEDETQEEPLPYIYWNPGQGYEVDPAYLETPKAESDSMSESLSESMSESTSESISESTSAPAGSAPAASNAPESTPASSSAPESTPASSSAPESTPASSSAPESTPASSSAPESTPASSSAPESIPASSSAPESIPASSSAPESTPASSGAPESTPASSSAPESTPASSSAPESTPTAESTPAPQAEHEAAQPAGALEQAGEVLDSLAPIQTAHAADSLEPQEEQGFFGRVLGWISQLFSPIAQFFRDFMAFALSANAVPAGDDANTGRSPLAPVKSFDMAMQRARELAAELGIGVAEITVYMMNPLEVTSGEYVEIGADMMTLKAWEGRNYDSDILFYLTGGVLSLRNTLLAPRVIDPNNVQAAGKALVWVYGGALQLENNVSVYGSFGLDFYQQESPRVWNAAAALSAQKYENPVIRLGEGFAPPADMGYVVQFKEQNDGTQQLELIQAPYLEESKMQEYAARFTVVGDTVSQWTYEVMGAQSEAAPMMARAAIQDGGKISASASLYAVRASDGVIYWDPINGNDSYDGTQPGKAYKTFAKALEMMNADEYNTIVCVNTVDLTAPDAKQVVPYNDATGQYELHFESTSDKMVYLETTTQDGFPVAKVGDGAVLSIKNLTLQSGLPSSALQTGGAVLTQSGTGQIILRKNVHIDKGYIEMVFDNANRIAPKPVQIDAAAVTANLYCNGISAATHWRLTELVQATAALIAEIGAGSGKTPEEQTAAHLQKYILLEAANRLTEDMGGTSRYPWTLVPGAEDQTLSSLYLDTAITYNAIYLDPLLGSDDNDGVNGQYPVKTLKRALEVYEEAIISGIAARKLLKEQGVSLEDRNKQYPLPDTIYVCSPIEVTETESWDWAQYIDHQDEEGNPVSLQMLAHDEPEMSTDVPDQPRHQLPQYVVRVKGGSLTLGASVKIGRIVPEGAKQEAVWINQRCLINVTDGGALTLTANAELFGGSKNTNTYNHMRYPGVGIVAGVQTAFYATGGGTKTVSASTVTLDEAWTGSIRSLGRGIVAAGGNTVVNMNGGTITDNHTDFEGAGISVFQSAVLNMNGGTITGNFAGSCGGGVYVENAAFNMKAGHIDANRAHVGHTALAPDGTSVWRNGRVTAYQGEGLPLGGGGIYINDSSFTMGASGADDAACTVNSNVIGRGGTVGSVGEVYTMMGAGILVTRPLKNAGVVLNSGSVSDNYFEDSSNANNSDIVSLHIAGLGVAAYTVNGNSGIQIGGVSISGNHLKRVENNGTVVRAQGGGFYMSAYASKANYRSLSVNGAEITNNSLPTSACTMQNSLSTNDWGGGGIYVDQTTFVLSGASVTGNQTANNGGGLFIGAEAQQYQYVAYLKDTTLSSNKASGQGGGIYGSFAWAKGLTITGNTADSGGGIVSAGARTLLSDCRVEQNTAAKNGGGLLVRSGEVTVTETAGGTGSLTANTAGESGGGIYIQYVANAGTDSVVLNIASNWENTAKTGANIYNSANSGCTAMYVLGGTFAGENSVYMSNEDSTKVSRLYVDMQKVSFEAAQGGGVYLANSFNHVVLLQTGDADHLLSIGLDNTKFLAGSLVVAPANLSKFSVKMLTEDAGAGGGYTVGQQQVTFANPVTDATTNQETYLTVSDAPHRTQLVGIAADAAQPDLISLVFLGEGVYLDGTAGSDKNDGKSPRSAVQTLGKATELLQKYSQEADPDTGLQPTIYVCGTMNISGDTTLTLPQGSIDTANYQKAEQAAGMTPEKVTLRRYSQFNNGPLMHVTGGTLTLQAIRVDGNAALTVSPQKATLVTVEQGAALNVTDGARLFNNKMQLIQLNSGGALTVSQSYPSTDVDTVNDEKYGAQISGTGMGEGYGAVSVNGAGTLTLSGNALITSEQTAVTANNPAGVQISLSDQSRVEAATGVARTGSSKGISLKMSGSSVIQGTQYAVSDTASRINDGSATEAFNIELSGSANLKGQTAAIYWAGGRAAQFITMTGESRIDGGWKTVSKNPGDVQRINGGALKIVMGTQGGTDKPVISNRIVDDIGTLSLTMYANSELYGGAELQGLSTLQNGVSSYGIFMYDNAKLFSSGHQYAVLLDTGETVAYNWNRNTPFAISLTGSSVIDVNQGNLCAAVAFRQRDGAQQWTMGDTQTITVTDNAQIKGFTDYGAFYVIRVADGNFPENTPNPFSSITVSKNARITPRENYVGNSEKNSGNPVLQSRKAVIEDSAYIGAPANQYDVPETWGKGVSVKADTLSLGGSVTVKGAIYMTGVMNGSGQPYPIVLTTAPTGDAGKFQLHIAEAFVGSAVVVPQGNNFKASDYLDYFVKAAAQGEAINLNLKAKDPNIVLDAVYHIYLSSSGWDGNDGSSPASAVRTFKKAKELLQTKQGYGEGSDIIIPDTVVVDGSDKLWSFDEGGYLTNKTTGDTWKPKVRRSDTGIYYDPMIQVKGLGTAADPMVFENITIGGGGDGMIISNLANPFCTSFLYVGFGNGNTYSNVTLGENTVIGNITFDLAKNVENGEFGYNYQDPNDVPVAFGMVVEGANVTIDGAVFENFNIESFSSALLYTDQSFVGEYNIGIITMLPVSGKQSVMEMKQGAIRGNYLGVNGGFYGVYTVGNAYEGTSIVNICGGIFRMSGGEISGNQIHATNIGYSPSGSANGKFPMAIITVTYGGKMDVSGGYIRDNINQNGLKGTGGFTANWYEPIICLGNDADSDSDKFAATTSLDISGGTIENNQAKHGSAVYVASGKLTLSGGIIRSNQNPNSPPGSENWHAEYSPIYIRADDGQTWFYIEGGDCALSGGAYLQKASEPIGATVIVSKEIYSETRVYDIYMETKELGALAVQPDGTNVLTVQPYAKNFNVHSSGRAGELGTSESTIPTHTVNLPESSCILLFRPVFVDGETGKDPLSIDLSTGHITAADGTQDNEIGLSPNKAVKTFDAAKLIGQAVDASKTNVDWNSHKKHKDYFLIVSLGPIYNELYTGEVKGMPNDGSVQPINTDAGNMTFSMEGASRMIRYTNFQIHLGDDTHIGGDEAGKQQLYNYDSIFVFRENGGPVNVTMKNIHVYGRRPVDATSVNGEALVEVQSGVTLTLTGDVTLARNNANGVRPGADNIDEPLDMRGGAMRILDGGNVIIQSVKIEEVQAPYGSAIYVEATATPGALTLDGTVSVQGDVYLCGKGENGAQGAMVNTTANFALAGGQKLALTPEIGFAGRILVQAEEGVTVDTAYKDMFTLPQRITGVYEVSISGTQLILQKKLILYINPQGGNDANDGQLPSKAFRTLDGMYDYLEKYSQGLVGVLVYVVNPIPIGATEEYVITNVSYTPPGGTLTEYYSQYTNVKTGDTLTLNCHVYFQRYVQPQAAEGAPEGTTVPAEYQVATNMDALFDISGMLDLNGVYVDGHSQDAEFEGNTNLYYPATQAQGPLIRVQGGGTFVCEFPSVNISGKDCTVGTTQLVNNVNTKVKTTPVPGTENTGNPVMEGSGAGLEILSSGQGASEATGKAFLTSTQFLNLRLGEGVTGGTDIYVNGQVSVSTKVFLEGSVYLEGHGTGIAGETVKETGTRWINVEKWGTPTQTAFSIFIRDPYSGRPVVRYPIDPNGGTITEVSNYMLDDDIIQYYTLLEEKVAADRDPMGHQDGAQVLFLTAPDAVYLDPVSGKSLQEDPTAGRLPTNAVNTLYDAFVQLKQISGKVIYVMNTVDIAKDTTINNEFYRQAGTASEVTLENSNYITIRRFVRPDIADSDPRYDSPTFDGVLFRVNTDASLVLDGNVEINGHSEKIGYGADAGHTPEAQRAQGAQSAGSLIQVQSGGVLRLSENAAAGTFAKLINNSNTKEGVQDFSYGGAVWIASGGNMYMEGGEISNNKSRPVPADALATASTGNEMGSADGIYSEGGLIVNANPKGAAGTAEKPQSITLAGGSAISMGVMLGEDTTQFHLSILDARVQREVVTYTAATEGVDSEAGHYVLDDTVPNHLFLVQSESNFNVLELQDWKVLKVGVPEEIFLGVHETSGTGTTVSRVDVDGRNYGDPTYTITNGGAYTARLLLTGFVQDAWQGGSEAVAMQLTSNPAELTKKPDSPLLYLAVAGSAESEASGNRFAGLKETPLKDINLSDPLTEVELGQLDPAEHGSFSFVGQANKAFIDAWMDEQFPSGTDATAEERQNYMRKKDTQTGKVSLNNAAAEYTLHYRIELVRGTTDAEQP